MSLQKYIKYLVYSLLVIFIIYICRKKIITKNVSVDSITPIEPSHSHDYAYKRAYLNPVNKNNETCRANKDSIKCMTSCKDMHYNFPKCVYSQPEHVALSYENGKETQHSKIIKSCKYY